MKSKMNLDINLKNRRLIQEITKMALRKSKIPILIVDLMPKKIKWLEMLNHLITLNKMPLSILAEVTRIDFLRKNI